MPLNLRETVGGLSHLKLRWQKSLLGRSPDFYLAGLKEPESLAGLITIVRSDEGRTNCPVCGYAYARLEIAGGWLFETCSAVGLKPLLKSSQFKKWLLALPGVEPAERPSELTSAGLPGVGL